MPREASRYHHDWFDKGEADFRAAEILLEQGGDVEIVAFHLRQSSHQVKEMIGVLKGKSLPEDSIES